MDSSVDIPHQVFTDYITTIQYAKVGINSKPNSWPYLGGPNYNWVPYICLLYMHLFYVYI